MTHFAHPGPDLPAARTSGPMGLWTGRAKALVLLALLALAGALAGWGTASAGDGGREGPAADNTRPLQATVTVNAARVEADYPDLTGADTGPVLAAKPVSPPGVPRMVAPHPTLHGRTATRAGHAARMPTGPPPLLSI